jgi:hypothetical protein
MERAGFSLSTAAAFFSVFLLGWQGYQGASADWVYGFLAVFWSLIMMLRLMTLTAPAEIIGGGSNLAQKIISNFRERQEETRQRTLENSFGQSYLLFLAAGLVFALWKGFCVAFPAQGPVLESLDLVMRNFFAVNDSKILFFEGRVFDWGQGFLLFLAFSMKGFVLRSYAAQKKLTRLLLLILCSYAAAGYIAFTGLEPAGMGIAIANADIMGNGSGAAFLLGAIPEGKTLSLFDIVLLESGIAGLAMLIFILFIPLGYICLSAQNVKADWMMVCCGMVTGSVMILSAFLTFTPLVGGLMALCWMALFLAWGGAENSLSERY